MTHRATSVLRVRSHHEFHCIVLACAAPLRISATESKTFRWTIPPNFSWQLLHTTTHGELRFNRKQRILWYYGIQTHAIDIEGLLHILLSKVDEDIARRSSPILGGCLAPVRVHFIFGSIGRVISIWEANTHRKRRIAHKLRTTRHDRVAVRIRMSVGKQLIFSLLRYFVDENSKRTVPQLEKLQNVSILPVATARLFLDCSHVQHQIVLVTSWLHQWTPLDQSPSCIALSNHFGTSERPKFPQ